MNQQTVNIKNFESYIVDYFDGILSEKEQQALFTFLKAHPQLAADFELFKQSEDAVVTPDSVTFPELDKLKKNVIFSVNDIHEFNYHDHFIAFYEGDLDESAHRVLFVFLEKNSFLLSEFENFGKLRLVPDKTLIFNNKQQLKHPSSRRPSAIWLTVASAAAVLLLFFLFSPTTDIQPPVTPDPPLVITDDIPSETPADTTFYTPTPNDPFSPQKELKPKTASVLPIAKIPSTDEATATTEHLPETLPLEQHTEMAEVVAHETIKTLEPDVVVIRTISDADTATEALLATYQEQQHGKSRLLKVLSWGVKQYNHIAKDDITVTKVENLTTNETTYYLCRGE